MSAGPPLPDEDRPAGADRPPAPAANPDAAAEERLHQLEGLLDTLPDCLNLKDRDGRFVVANQATAALMGAPGAAALIGRTDHDFYLADVAARFRQDEDQVLATGRPTVIEQQIIRPDGSVEWLSTLKAPLRDRAGRIAGIVTHNRTITDRKAAEDALARQKEFLKAVLDNAGAAIVAWLPGGEITLFNPEAETLTGYPAAEILGRRTPVLWHDPAELARRALELSAELGEPVVPGIEVLVAKPRLGGGETREWTWLRRDGGRIPVLISVSALRDAEHAVSGFLGVARDISEIKAAARELADQIEREQSANRELQRSNAELSAARRVAEAATASQRQFLSNISHEMRTPLNAMIGYQHLLEGMLGTDSQRDLLAKLSRASQALLDLVDNVLDLSKIEAGELHLSHEPVDLKDTLDSAASVVEGLVAEKGLRLVVEAVPAELSRCYLGDPLRVRQILLNLLVNAVKFTERGEVRACVRAMRSATGRQRLRFEVADTGIGIPAEELGRLFSRFSQVDAGKTRRFGGTGLGLAIVRELAERMGGSVDVRSEPGAGSIFGVEIELESGGPVAAAAATAPVAAAAATAPAAGLETRLDGIRILVVDDSPMNLEVARRLLARLGAEVATCGDGREALDWLHHHRADAVIMDVQMPTMDGNTAASIMRLDPRLRHLPVIAMTAGATLSEREQSLKAGMDAYITKPFQIAKLAASIRSLLASPRAIPSVDGPYPGPPPT